MFKNFAKCDNITLQSLRMSEISREVEDGAQGETNNSYQRELNVRSTVL